MLIHPRDFRAEYVRPAIELFGQHMLVKHLAVHAISQLDTLAEMVALHQLAGTEPKKLKKAVSDFRNELGTRYLILNILRDAHNGYKHGKLVRTGKTEDPQGVWHGERPEQIEGEAFFCGVTACGGPLTAYDALAVKLNDGTQREVFDLLSDGERAWNAEFKLLGL